MILQDTIDNSVDLKKILIEKDGWTDMEQHCFWIWSCIYRCSSGLIRRERRRVYSGVLTDWRQFRFLRYYLNSVEYDGRNIFMKLHDKIRIKLQQRGRHYGSIRMIVHLVILRSLIRQTCRGLVYTLVQFSKAARGYAGHQANRSV